MTGPRANHLPKATSLDYLVGLAVRGSSSTPRPDELLRRERLEDAAVGGQLEVLELAWMYLAHLTAGPHQFEHRPHAGEALIELAFQLQGTGILTQRGTSTRVGAGEWILLDVSESYIWSNRDAVNRLSLLVPRSRLASGTSLRLLEARPGQSSISRVLYAASATLLDESAFVAAAHAAPLAESLTMLFNISVIESEGPPLWSHARVNVADRVRHYIAQHVRDPNLSIGAIAKALGKSKRALQRATQHSETWIRDQIWQLRLERARDDLFDPGRRGESISQIAASWGYRSASHFSRAFRRRYGLTPRQARRGIGPRPS